MSNFETNYQPLPYEDNDGDDNHHESETMIYVVPESSKSRWNHIDDLDSFFSREVLELAQFVFMVFFSSFLIRCVDYPVLFHDKLLPFIPIFNSTGRKVTLSDVIIPMDQCVEDFNWPIIVCILIAAVIWVTRCLKVFINIFKNYEIKCFFTTALKIVESDLDNMTWHEVQRRMQEVQREQQMCIHKQELTELDIYHRILRTKNYMVAMINKNLLPLKFRVPFIGEVVYLTNGLKYNLEYLLFDGMWSAFANRRLRDDFKKQVKRKELANQLEVYITIIAAANFLFSPIVMLYNILNVFFKYAENIKREPAILSTRRWSIYSRLYLRHFNELDHELNARLNRAYKSASKYVSSFTSYTFSIICKSIIFFAGSILAVFVVLAVIDEDVLHVEHVLFIMTVLSMLVALCRACIPDEHMIWIPEKLISAILQHTHYMPEHFKGNAHTTRVKDEFTQLFQYKMTFIIEEMLSPIITPIILYFYLRPKSLDIVDFYRNFTVEVVGVGDVCSFALMDVKKHGHPQWVPEQALTEANQIHQAEHGKTELSLMHFTLTNPDWKPPQNSKAFITQLQEQVQRNAEMSPFTQDDNPLYSSLNSLSSLETGYSRNILLHHHLLSQHGGHASFHEPGTSVVDSYPPSARSKPSVFKGGVNRTEGPTEASGSGLLSSAHQSMLSNVPASLPYLQNLPNHDLVPTEMTTTNMSFSALYIHELHHRILRSGHAMADARDVSLWQRPDMSGIKEEEEKTEMIPLLDTKISRSS